MDNNETLKDIVAEMRGEKGFPVPFAPMRGIWLSDYHALADRIEAACQREAALLIPAKNIEFFDGNGRRQIASGWVKQGGAR